MKVPGRPLRPAHLDLQAIHNEASGKPFRRTQLDLQIISDVVAGRRLRRSHLEAIPIEIPERPLQQAHLNLEAYPRRNTWGSSPWNAVQISMSPNGLGGKDLHVLGWDGWVGLTIFLLEGEMVATEATCSTEHCCCNVYTLLSVCHILKSNNIVQKLILVVIASDTLQHF